MCRLAALITTFCFGSVLSLAQADSTKLSAKVLNQDLQFLNDLLLETHQNPYFYCTVADYDQAFLNAQKAVENGLCYADFALQVATLLRTVQDSHTYLKYAGLSQYNAKRGGRFLDISIAQYEGSIFVTSDRFKALERGSKLISINGHSADSLFQIVKEFSIREGNSHIGEQRIAEAIFSTVLPLLIDIKLSNHIVIEQEAGQTTTIPYPGLTSKELSKLRKKSKGSPYSLSIEADTAVLRIKSFSAGNDRPYYRFLYKSFRKLKRQSPDFLIIDVRGNTGGSAERMEALLAYLLESPVAMPANIIGKQSELARERHEQTFRGLNKYILTHFFKRNEDVQNYLRLVNLESGMTDTLYYHDAKGQSKLLFKGSRVILLINGTSGSATVNLAGAFAMHHAGAIFGEAPLGPKGGTWGNPAETELPNSGLKIYVSTIRFNSDNLFSNDPTPIQPDHAVSPTLEDLREGRDAVLEATLLWLKETK
jgi:hypothetical protein